VKWQPPLLLNTEVDVNNVSQSTNNIQFEAPARVGPFHEFRFLASKRQTKNSLLHVFRFNILTEEARILGIARPLRRDSENGGKILLQTKSSHLMAVRILNTLYIENSYA